MSTFIPDSDYSYESQRRRDRLLQGGVAFILAVGVGLLAFAVATILPERMKITRVAILPVGVAVMLVTLRLQLLFELFLVGWVFALTYARNYYLITTRGESQGLYWIPSDAALVALLGVWGLHAVYYKRWREPTFTHAWLILVPLLGVHIVSIFAAERPDWVLYDLMRPLRALLILIVLPAMLTRRLWWVTLGGVAVAVLFQSAMGAYQVALKKASYVLEGETLVRAAGTMMHPNLLAGFLLIAIPIFLALGLASRHFWLRWGSAAVGLIGLAGLVLTMSRTPIALVAGQIVLLGVVLIARGLASPKHIIALAAIGTLVVAGAAYPFKDKIIKRITGNWNESVDFRAQVNDFAFGLFEKNPVLGIGYSHFTEEMADFQRTYGSLYRDNVEDAKKINARYMLAVHNAYLLSLAEGGALGFTGFLFMIGSALFLGVRAVGRTTGDWQIACLGMTIGLVGLYGQGLTEYSMHIEQVFYPFIVVVALLSTAPALCRQDVRAAGGAA